jgi:5-methyltetrahydrofolate--homocysteine methyltransferase
MEVSPFLARLKEGGVLVSDGATGTNLQKRGLPRGVAGELWVLERPEEILRLHRDFIEAGADIVLTCTFGGTSVRLEHAGLADRAEAINRKGVELARQAVKGTACLVAGSIGPTGQLLKPYGPLEVEAATAAFAAQAKTLSQAGADLLVIETQFDLGEAEAAIQGVRSVSSLPLVCSFSYDRGVVTMMGVRPAQAGRQLEAWGVDVVGINCGRSLDENLNALKELKTATDLPVWFKPNAGLPRLDDDGCPVYDVTPENMGFYACDWVAVGANVVGGCCGTSPEHLQQIALKVK